MTLAPITHCLPILLGYLLFVGVSGRLDPLSRPARLADRPSWALGLWVGASVAGVLSVGLHLAYSTSLGEARALVAPSAWALSALLLPGFVAWIFYGGAVARALDAEARAHRTSSPLAARIGGFPVVNGESGLEADPANEIGPAVAGAAVGEETAGPVDAATDEITPLVAAFLDVGGPARLDIPDIPVARADVEVALDARGVALLADSLASAPIVVDAVPRDEHEVDAPIALEEALESRIRESAAAESRATRETARRIEAESAVAALTRRAVRARARLENRIRELEETLARREATLSGVVRALERERGPQPAGDRRPRPTTRAAREAAARPTRSRGGDRRRRGQADPTSRPQGRPRPPARPERLTRPDPTRTIRP